jgi:hypothetical protein
LCVDDKPTIPRDIESVAHWAQWPRVGLTRGHPKWSVVTRSSDRGFVQKPPRISRLLARRARCVSREERRSDASAAVSAETRSPRYAGTRPSRAQRERRRRSWRPRQPGGWTVVACVASDGQRSNKSMSRGERIANLLGVVVPFVGVIVAVGLLWNHGVDGIDLAILGVMYLLSAVGVTVGFHRLLTHRAFQTYPWLERDVRRARVAVGARLGDGLGCRPPQAPRPCRQGGRPPQSARRTRQRAAWTLACPYRLAARDPGSGRLEAIRGRALRRSAHAADRTPLPGARAGLAPAPDASRLHPARLHP